MRMSIIIDDKEEGDLHVRILARAIVVQNLDSDDVG